MSEWKEYIGSEEQLKEIMGCKNGFALKSCNGVCATALFGVWPLLGKLELKRYLSVRGTTHYLICNPHPLADMICQQARTGQEVWVDLREAISSGLVCGGGGLPEVYSTYQPNWDYPGGKYSFTPFEE